MNDDELVDKTKEMGDDENTHLDDDMDEYFKDYRSFDL